MRLYVCSVEPLEKRKAYETAYGAVSEARRERVDHLRTESAKRLSLGAALLLRHAVREAGYAPERLTVSRGGSGKPFFPEAPELRFNLSHSGSLALCAVSGQPIGCDIELLREDQPEVARRFFHADEYKAYCALQDAEERRLYFYRLWTVKESFLKAAGFGLSYPLSGFRVDPEDGSHQIGQSVLPERYYYREFSGFSGYRAAVCAPCPELPEPETLSVETLLEPERRVSEDIHGKRDRN